MWAQRIVSSSGGTGQADALIHTGAQNVQQGIISLYRATFHFIKEFVILVVKKKKLGNHQHHTPTPNTLSTATDLNLQGRCATHKRLTQFTNQPCPPRGKTQNYDHRGVIKRPFPSRRNHGYEQQEASCKTNGPWRPDQLDVATPSFSRYKHFRIKLFWHDVRLSVTPS